MVKINKEKLLRVAQYGTARLSEPSSWASISAFLGALNFTIADQLWQHVVVVGSGVAAAAGFLMKELRDGDQ